jgi:hypothetical protein
VLFLAVNDVDVDGTRLEGDGVPPDVDVEPNLSQRTRSANSRADLFWRFHRTCMITVVEYGTFSTKQRIYGTCDADLETLNTTSERDAIGRFTD